MRPPDEAIDFATLRRCWRQWTAVVELFARRRPLRHVVAPQQYEALHRELLAACRTPAGMAAETKRDFYQDLESLVQPWLSLYVLEQTPRDILFDLFARCQQVERELGCRTWVDNLRRWALPLAALLTVAAGVALLVWTADRVLLPALVKLSDCWQVVWFATKRSSATQQWGAAGILAIVIAIFLLTRSPRS
jgi:hypothetical protein